jgi:Membrane bound O-acyl transferase family
VYSPVRDADWQMSIFFVLSVVLLGFMMKLVALLVPSASGDTRWSFVLSPLPSPNSLARKPGSASGTSYLRRIALCGGALVLYYWLYWHLVRRFNLAGPVLAYLAAPVLLLLAECVSALMALIRLTTGGPVRPLLDEPPLARGVADFWGRRWNLWFSDWFRYAVFAPLRRRPVLALLVVFAISGLMHELVINVPLFFVTGRALFGSMMFYFMIQGVGVLIENRFTRPNSAARVVLVWLVVLGPAPLLFNEGLLRSLHLWPG